MSDCQHEKWARQRFAHRPAPVPLHELVIGKPKDPCPWCAKDSGRDMVKDMMGRLVEEKNTLRAQLSEAIEALRVAKEALNALAGWVPYGQGYAETDQPKYIKALAAIDAVLAKVKL